ncbi:MAG: cupin domain-containing protein [Pseudomonadota bacterium]
MKLDPAQIPREDGDNGVLLLLSAGGGLTQFGAYADTLAPGAYSSTRHWHSTEDEMVYILSGTVTAIDDDGAHVLQPGDAACWRHGDPNAHHLFNHSALPCTYLIIGSRAALDICTYPDTGERQINGATDWRIERADGTIRRQGALPAALLNLRAVWGTPFDPAQSYPRILPDAARPWMNEPENVHKILGRGLGAYRYQLISDLGGLSQFGAFIEELPPGSLSGHRHWHADEDEMVYMLSGEAVLIEDSDISLRAGDTACWPAGVAVGHRLANRSSAAVRYLVIGTRHQRDAVHYTDHDLITHKDGSVRRYLHRDGTAYPDRRTT